MIDLYSFVFLAIEKGIYIGLWYLFLGVGVGSFIYIVHSI